MTLPQALRWRANPPATHGELAVGGRRLASACPVPGAAVAVLLLLASACGGGDDDAAGDPDTDPCELVTPAIQTTVEEGIGSVLSGAVPESPAAAGGDCVQRFTAGDDWVELTFRIADGDDAGFQQVADGLATDGVQTTRVEVDGDWVEVVASTSDPASISTWDASLVGALAFDVAG